MYVPIGICVSDFDGVLWLIGLDHGLGEACVGDGELWSAGG